MGHEDECLLLLLLLFFTCKIVDEHSLHVLMAQTGVNVLKGYHVFSMLYLQR